MPYGAVRHFEGFLLSVKLTRDLSAACGIKTYASREKKTFTRRDRVKNNPTGVGNTRKASDKRLLSAPIMGISGGYGCDSNPPKFFLFHPNLEGDHIGKEDKEDQQPHNSRTRRATRKPST